MLLASDADSEKDEKVEAKMLATCKLHKDKRVTVNFKRLAMISSLSNARNCTLNTSLKSKDGYVSSNGMLIELGKSRKTNHEENIRV